MATKITMTVADELTEQECDDLQLLLCDALGEFATRRYPAEQYVEERYPSSNEGYAWLNRPKKVTQVQRRIALAQKLHTAVFEHIIEPEPRAAKRAYDEQRATRKHTNHVMCFAANAACGPTCKAFWPGIHEETLEAMAQSGERAQASVLLLQDLFGMEEEEARATYNQLEDKRVAKLMAAQGLVTS